MCWVGRLCIDGFGLLCLMCSQDDVAGNNGKFSNNNNNNNNNINRDM